MFGTLRYNRRGDDAKFIDQTDVFLAGDSNSLHSACDTCRSRKLKCSGQKSGCDRCESMSVACKYSPSTNARGARRRKREGDSSAYRDLTRTKSSAQASSALSQEPLNLTSNDALDGPGEATEQIWSFLTPMGQDTQKMTIDDSAPEKTSHESPPAAHNADDIDLFSETSFGQLNSDFELPDVDDIFAFDWTSLLSQSKATFPRINTAISESSNIDAPTYSPVRIETEAQTSLSSTSGAISSPQPSSLPASAKRLETQHGRMRSPMSFEEVGHPKSRRSSTRDNLCHCLPMIVTLLEKLGNISEAVDRTVLDIGLAMHKTSLSHCRTILRCGRCISKPEYFKLLALVSEKLVHLCELIVDYNLQSNSGATKSLPSIRENQPRRVVSFGQYKIDQQPEIDCVVRVLISLQIRALWSLLVDMKKAGPTTEVSKLEASERRLQRAIESIFQARG